MAGKTIQTRILSSPVDSLKKFRLGLPASGDPRIVVNLAGLGKSLITTRTQKGEGAGGRSFAPYSKKTYYAPIDRRPPGYPSPSGGEPTKSGKSVKYAGGYAEYHGAQGFGSKVTLTVSGSMLGAIQIAVGGPTVAYLFFASREQAAKAHGHQFGTVVPKREFFDLSDFESEQELKAETVKELRSLARRAKLELQGRPS